MKISNFTKSNSPISLIINVSNPVALELAEALLEQGSKVLISDLITPHNKEAIKQLLSNENALFVDIDSIGRHTEDIVRLDYTYYFLNSKITGSSYPNIRHKSLKVIELSHQDFQKETNRLDSYLKLSIQFASKFSLITSGYLSQFYELLPETNLQLQRYSESLCLDYSKRTGASVRVIRLGEVFGKKVDLAIPTHFTNLIRGMFYGRSISIIGEGLQNNYLIDVQDAVFGILKLTFSERTKGKIYLLSNPSPISSLNLAYSLLELTDEDKDVEFLEESDTLEKIADLKEMCFARSTSEIGWEPKVEVQDALKKSLDFASSSFGKKWREAKVESIVTTVKKQLSSSVVAPKVGEKLNESKDRVEIVKWKLIYFLYSFFIKRLYDIIYKLPLKLHDLLSLKFAKRLLSFLFIILCLSFLLFPYITIASGLVKIMVFSSNRAELWRRRTEVFTEVRRINRSIDRLLYLDYFIPKEYRAIKELANNSVKIADSVDSFDSATEPLRLYLERFKMVDINNPSGQGADDYYSELQKLSGSSYYIKKAYNDIEPICESNGLNITNMPPFLQSQLVKANEYIKFYCDAIVKLKEIYPYLQFILGYKNRTNYVILVQNQDELRATGGWPTNFAFVGIENGRIRDFTIEDVYTVDGQVDGQIADTEMISVLGVQNYKLSLSNWNPELDKSYASVTKILSTEYNRSPNIDFLITVNLSLIEDLLELTGGITTESYGTVTKENLFNKVVEIHSNFTPGSTAKTTVSKEVLPKLIQRVKEQAYANPNKVLSIFSKNMRTKAIQVYSPKIKDFLENRNSYNSFYKYRTNFFSVVDWNWSGNKANRYISRATKLSYNETIKELKLEVTYKNSSTKNFYPEGIYKNYLRIYSSKNFTLRDFNGLYKGYLPPHSFTSGVNFYNKDYYDTVGGWSIAPLQSETVVRASFYGEVSPDFTYVKQPGVDNEFLTFSLLLADQNSKFSENNLLQQGFTRNGKAWERTVKVSEDVKIIKN